MKYCERNKELLFAYMVLEQGALTGYYNYNHPFPKRTRRARAFSKQRLKQIEPLILEMKNIGLKIMSVLLKLLLLMLWQKYCSNYWGNES